MKYVIQVVSKASVEVEGKIVGSIDKGFLVLIGIGQDDTKEIADKMMDKLVKLRIFDDENGKTNLSLADVNGSLLLVSQFTLYANCKKGNRPSFTDAGAPRMSERVPKVERGIFGADMKVSLVNEGPFTVILDSEQILG